MVRFGFAYRLEPLFCGRRLNVLEACGDPSGSEPRTLSSRRLLDGCAASVRLAHGLLAAKYSLGRNTSPRQVRMKRSRSLRAEGSNHTFGSPVASGFGVMPSTSTVPRSQFRTDLFACGSGSRPSGESTRGPSAVILGQELHSTAGTDVFRASIIETSRGIRFSGGIQSCQARLHDPLPQETGVQDSSIRRNHSMHCGV